MSILADAMSADAATSAPTKRGRKAWLIALAVVVAVVAIVLLATPPKPEPVKVWFVRATNEAGVKKLVFEGTNGIPRQIELFAGVATGAIPQPKTVAALVPRYDLTFATVAAGTSFYFSLDAPSKDVPYYMAWQFHDIGAPAARWGRFGLGCKNFFRAHGMPALADRFITKDEVHYIPSTEIKE